MKKFFTLMFLVCIFSTLSFAQMQLGIKAGLNLANLSGDDISDTDSRTGFAGGLFFMYQFSDMFAIQPEAYYTMKGATDKGTIEGFSYDAEIKLDYIEVPLLLKFLIPIKGSGIKPAIFAGPSVGFNLSAKSKIEAGGQTFEEDMQDVASTDFGLVFGGGIGFPVGNGELGLDIRYILGLSTIDDSADKADVKNSVINFNLYYGFNLK
jgi:Outer membrane protein beta-barrel domain